MDLSQIEWAEKLSKNEDAVVLDVRTASECAEGIIPNAKMIDIFKGQGFIYEVEALDKAKSYFVYCKAGGRSAQVCQIMNQLGFTNTYNLVGGFMQWQGEVAFP
jgi:rhodanese-related sulfurtransferase